MNNIKAITQLEELKKERLSFVQNNDLDKVYLEDIKAISLAIKALKKSPDISDNSFRCRVCGKELKTWKSIQKGFGPVCEKRYIESVYKNQQITIEAVMSRKSKREEK